MQKSKKLRIVEEVAVSAALASTTTSTAMPIMTLTPIQTGAPLPLPAVTGGPTNSIQMSNMITQMLAQERIRRLEAIKAKSKQKEKSENKQQKSEIVSRVRKNYFKLGRTQQSKLKTDIRKEFLDLAKTMLKPMGLYLSNLEVCPIEALEMKGKDVVKMDEESDDEDEEQTREIELDALDKSVEFKLFSMEQFIEDKKSKPSINKLMFYKDKFSISDKCYAQLHKHCSLRIPPLNQIRKWRAELDSLFKIYNNEMGVFLSFEDKLRFRLIKYFELKYGTNVDLNDDQYFVERGQRPFHDHIIHVKLSADGTNIGRNLKLLNFTFTILNEGAKAKQAAGNYTLGIYEIENESHATLTECFKEIVEELQRVNEIEVNGRKVKVVLYYGADWKMLAIVLGLLSANSKYPCVWCKCPKEEFHLYDQDWSIVEPSQGARSPQEQRELVSQNQKKSYAYSYQRNPIFGDLIPYSRYMIDMLHLFLRISDTLFNLLIKDCSLADNLELTNLNKFDLKKYKHMNSLQHFLNEKCGVRFQFYWIAETKKLTWRDLTGPEKHRLFDKFNLAEIMPDHERFQDVEKIWFDFYEMLEMVKQVEIDAVELKERTVEWLKLYLGVYSKTTVTPYMHAFVTHLPEFVHLYKDINAFTCQGLEKLNDMTTGQFFKGTNKLDTALHQVLKKRNRMELLCSVDDNFDN